MPETLLSIVCPVYNCECHLETLIESLIQGANRETVEVVFVDDCSTDNSAELCRQLLEARASRIRFSTRLCRHEVNQGVSAARNTGIHASTGEYIGFLDSDDVVLPGYAEVILGELSKGSPSVVEFGFREFREDHELQGLPARSASGKSTRVYRGDTRHRLLFRYGFFSWSRVYRREIVEAVMFVADGRAYEDIAFTIGVFAYVDEVHKIDEELIGYRKRAGSITAVRNKRFTDQFTQLNEAMKTHRERLGGRFELECRYVMKLVVVLLKALKIQPDADRLDFYRAVNRELNHGSTLYGNVFGTVSRSLSSLLLCATKTVWRRC